jgi:3-oxoacyl-[acyl-carrier protein] reductase
LGIVRTASRELARYNIRVNALLPRAQTRLVETMPDQLQPMDLPEPEEVAPLNAYLLSDAAKDISGQSIQTAGETVGLVSDPEVYKTITMEGGWTAETFADSFKGILGRDEDLGPMLEGD